jgi:hypothetical protein
VEILLRLCDRNLQTGDNRHGRAGRYAGVTDAAEAAQHTNNKNKKALRERTYAHEEFFFGE